MTNRRLSADLDSVDHMPSYFVDAPLQTTDKQRVAAPPVRAGRHLQRRPPSEASAIRTGLLLFQLWVKYVGLWSGVAGCLWTIIRRYTGLRALASLMMPKVRTIDLAIDGMSRKFEVRWPSSDIHIAYSILIRGEYSELVRMVDKSKPVVILDVGANIGAASVFLMREIPNSRVIAIEPDPGNASLCARNLAPFGDRAVVIEAALWSENAWLTFEPGTQEVGAEAGVQIRPVRVGETGTVRGVDVPTALAQAGISDTSCIALKIDAEGAECEIFRTNTEWLGQVECIAIELHDYLPGSERSSESFFASVGPHVIETVRTDDTVFVRLSASGRKLHLHDTKQILRTHAPIEKYELA